MTGKIDLTRPDTYPTFDALVDGDPQRLFDFAAGVDWQGKPLAPPSVVAGVERIAGSLGAPIDNMGPTNRKPAESGGYDTIEVLLYGRWAPGSLTWLASSIETARAGQSEETLAEMVGESVTVWPGGARRGLYCSWVFRWAGCTIGVVNREESSKDGWGVHVSIGSVACMERGGAEAFEEVKAFLARIGFTCAGNLVSRVDCCVDLPGIDAHDVTLCYVGRCCVMRGRKGEVYEDGLRYTGFRRGSGQRILMRVYDKLGELNGGKEDAIKEALLIERRWGGVLPKAATRVEFQLRREAIADFAIETFEEFHARAGEVVGWLAQSWFRMTERVPDRGNTQHFGPSVLWKDVQRRFAESFGKAVKPQRRRKPLVGGGEMLGKQITGCLTTLMAVAGEVPERIDDVIRACARLIRREGERLLDDVFAKRCKIENLVGGLRLTGVCADTVRPFPEFLDFAPF